MWQGEGDGRERIWSYPAELGTKTIGHKNPEKSNCDGDENTWQPPRPICPSPSVLWVSHIPSTSALTHTQGCHSPAGGCPDLCLGRLLTLGLLLLPLPTHAHPRRLQGAGNAVATAASSPTSRGPAPLPSPRGCAARPRSSTPAEGTFVSRGTFCLLLSSASRGDRPPPETKAEAAAAAGGASREGARASDTHTPPHARKCPGDRGPRWTRGATNTSDPCRAPPSSTSRPGLSRPPRPPVPSTLRPLSAQGRRGSRESPERPPAANSPASAGAASRELARRGAQGKRLLRRPRRPDAGPGPSGWQTRGASEAQASAAAAAFQLTPRVRASGRGRGSLTRCQAPRTTWLPGCRAAQAAH